MTDQIHTELPDGVLVSTDAGAPSAFLTGSRPDGLPAGPSAPVAEPLNHVVAALEVLEFAEVLEDVAARAVGPLGAESIRARRPSADGGWIREELERVEELARLERAGRRLVAEPVPELAAPLARLRIAGSVLDGPELLAFRRTLSAARLVTAELRRIAADAPRVARLELPLPEKTLERRLEQALDDDGGVLDTASPALAAARSDIRTARERLVQKLDVLLRSVGGDGGVTLREGRYVIPVPRDLRHRPEGIVHGESASGATLYIEPAAAIALGNAMREAEARAAREELKVLRGLSEMLRPAHGQLAALHDLCVTIDDLSARAKWAFELDGHAPVVAPAPAELRIVNGRHPLLISATQPSGVGASACSPGRGQAPPTPRPGEHASAPGIAAHTDESPSPVVPFDLTLEDTERCVLLSGPNTGGKSVLLKGVGLIAALTQSGIVPPVGPGSALPIFERVFADIGDRQSIAASLSTFSAHLALLRVILSDADERSLVLLDEIGSGTDPAEGGALAAATLMALTRRGAVTIATTHLGSLKRLATSAPGIVNASLQFDAATLQPTYRLVKGVPGRSYGLAIARRLGLREDVLAEAEAQVPEAERSLDALLAAVEERERAQLAREAELAGRLAELETRAGALAAQMETQGIRETALRKRERDAERTAREQARCYLLEARETVEAAIARAHVAGEDAAREARRLVEQAAAHEAGVLRKLEEADRRTGGPADGVGVGTRVRMESGTVGEVLEVRGDGKLVLRVGSLKLVADPDSVTSIDAGQPSAGPPVRPSARSAVHPPARPSASPVSPAPSASYELDLRGMTGDEAEQALVAALDAAVLAEQPSLRIIHGKGTGVVRERVQQVLKRDRRVTSHAFAPANQGGSGVTVAELE